MKLFEELSARPLAVIDEAAAAEMARVITDARAAGDSVGGTIECAITGLPMALGEHMFDGVEGRISSILFAIPAVKAVEFGAGFSLGEMRGSESNDPYVTDGKAIATKTNNCGGILGGMTNGMPVIFRIAVKPTPSIAREQQTVSLKTMQNTAIRVGGRHDPCILPRAVPVVEAAAAIAVLDLMLDNEEL